MERIDLYMLFFLLQAKGCIGRSLFGDVYRGLPQLLEFDLWGDV